MGKLNIAVLFGGASTEHDVSLISATTIIKNLDKEKYRLKMIGITSEGEFYVYHGDIAKIKTGAWQYSSKLIPCVISPDRKRGGIVILSKDGFEIEKIDCAIPCLHGKAGEDGTIQGLLELGNIPFVGCDTLSSAICMDKEITHIVSDYHGVKTAQWVCAKQKNINEAFIKETEEKLGYPMFVKPANAGSSIGVSKAKDRQSLLTALKLAFTYDKKVLIEKAIVGIEVECAVLGNENPKVSIAGEIESCKEFYDFEAKYQAADSKLYIPARIDENVMEEVRTVSLKVYEVMGCKGLARVDFFVTATNEVILNEINTFPGFTSISMYPKLWEKSGISIKRLIEQLVDFALQA